MHIIVTIPKTRLKDVQKEEEDVKRWSEEGKAAYYFWSLARRPKNLQKGDRCYFVWDGAMREYHIVCGFAQDMTCETTGRYYPGFSIILRPEIHEIEPVPMKSFRGFKYYKESE